MTRIVIADDQALFREGLRTLLSTRPDMDVVGEAANGDEAVALVEQLRPSVVLMDLRRLRAANQGALFEVSLVIQRVPLDRIVLLVDEQTDEEAVTGAIEKAWNRLPPDSPNASMREPRVRWLLCSGWRGGQERRIGKAVFAAAFGANHPTAAAEAVEV